MGSLEGKVVVVTGAGRGIGRAVALDAAREGARIVVNDYGVSMDGEQPTSEVADGVVAEIKELGGEAVANASSVAEMAGGASIVQSAVDHFGRVDGVVCAAGILRERMLFNMAEEEWDPVIATHLKGTFTVFRAASAVMRKQKSGSLVGVTSGAFAASVAQANYSAAKGGIVSSPAARQPVCTNTASPPIASPPPPRVACPGRCPSASKWASPRTSRH